MKKLFKTPYPYLLIPIILGIGLCLCARYIAGFADWYYVNFYKPLAGAIGTLVGFIPFSLMELCIFVIVFCLPAGCFIVHIISKRKNPEAHGAALFHFALISVFLITSIFFTSFCFFSATNYYKMSFSDSFFDESTEFMFASEHLSELCADLTERANTLGAALEHRDDGTTVYDGSDFEMAKKAAAEYRRLYEKCPQLEVGGDSYGTPKPVICSFVMSKLLISGVYSPYTLEANVCTEGPDFLRGSTMMHEQSHLRGYMNEAEANFIAFLACENSEDPYFQYSGTCSALIYAMNALYKDDYESWLEIRQTYSDTLEADMQAQNAYVAANKGTVSTVSDKVNDTYLKLNSQPEGVKSYSLVVNLLLAYWQTK